jgi:uracil-DNA glycosylase
MGSSDSIGKPPVIEQGWHRVLAQQFTAPYFSSLKQFLIEERLQHRIYPRGSQIFAAFNHTPFNSTRVVILGQDPYHGEGQAHGLCFSVPAGIRKPPSLNNIFRELQSDLGIPPSESGDLTPWARQGVLLLNTTLTVRANAAASHQGRGWETFTDVAIRGLSEQHNHLVFLLWGNPAQRKAGLIDRNRHLILTAPHPSPLSAHRGFIGCRHFSLTNKYLQKKNLPTIDWNTQSDRS